VNKMLISIIEAGTIVERQLEIAMQPVAFSVAQLRLMLAVAAEPGIGPSKLAATILQETHSVSGLLNRLEDRGLIDRRRNRTDRRVVNVHLTGPGRVVLDEARTLIGSASSRIIRALAKAPDPAEVRDALYQEFVPAKVKELVS